VDPEDTPSRVSLFRTLTFSARVTETTADGAGKGVGALSGSYLPLVELTPPGGYKLTTPTFYDPSSGLWRGSYTFTEEGEYGVSWSVESSTHRVVSSDSGATIAVNDLQSGSDLAEGIRRESAQAATQLGADGKIAGNLEFIADIGDSFARETAEAGTDLIAAALSSATSSFIGNQVSKIPSVPVRRTQLAGFVFYAHAEGGGIYAEIFLLA